MFAGTDTPVKKDKVRPYAIAARGPGAYLRLHGSSLWWARTRRYLGTRGRCDIRVTTYLPQVSQGVYSSTTQSIVFYRLFGNRRCVTMNYDKVLSFIITKDLPVNYHVVHSFTFVLVYYSRSLNIARLIQLHVNDLLLHL